MIRQIKYSNGFHIILNYFDYTFTRARHFYSNNSVVKSGTDDRLRWRIIARVGNYKTPRREKKFAFSARGTYLYKSDQRVHIIILLYRIAR